MSSRAFRDVRKNECVGYIRCLHFLLFMAFLFPALVSGEVCNVHLKTSKSGKELFAEIKGVAIYRDLKNLEIGAQMKNGVTEEIKRVQVSKLAKNAVQPNAVEVAQLVGRRMGRDEKSKLIFIAYIFQGGYWVIVTTKASGEETFIFVAPDGSVRCGTDTTTVIAAIEALILRRDFKLVQSSEIVLAGIEAIKKRLFKD